MERHKQPITLFGVSLKVILSALFFLVLLLAVFDPLDFQLTMNDRISVTQRKDRDTHQSGQQNTIVATPEMILKAMNEIRAERIAEYEQTETISPTDRFFYVIELSNGGDIEATDVTIETEIVTIVSRNGIETTLPRATINNIRRYKLPDQQKPQSSP